MIAPTWSHHTHAGTTTLSRTRLNRHQSPTASAGTGLQRMRRGKSTAKTASLREWSNHRHSFWLTVLDIHKQHFWLTVHKHCFSVTVNSSACANSVLYFCFIPVLYLRADSRYAKCDVCFASHTARQLSQCHSCMSAQVVAKCAHVNANICSRAIRSSDALTARPMRRGSLN